ncbi:Hsp20/alpha crystallin family protein [bacterium]|nr:Hsp20/alpha crystallin family protein [bacterium]MBU1881117.1 Hsp20/alpha crystallin family protein [bacterium]
MSDHPEDKAFKTLRDFHNLSEEIELVLEDYFSDHDRPIYSASKGFLPPLDCFETENEIICMVELAGVAPQDLKVTQRKHVLTISGERRELPSFEKRRYHKMELDFGAFERHITIPESVIPDKMSIENLGGFYLIRLKKVKPGLKPFPNEHDPASPDPRR